MTDQQDKSALERGRELLADLQPPLEKILADRYDELVPELSESIVEWGYGRHYARPGLDLKTRFLLTVGALTVLGAQPQIRINVLGALRAGASRTEITESIWQMALFAGMPAAMNALDTAKAAFDEIDSEAS